MTRPDIYRVESDVYDPAGGDAGSIVGKYLTGTTAVYFGVTPCTNVTVVSDTSVTFTAPAKAAGKYPVAVRNADGWTSLAEAVEYANPGTIANCVWWLRPDDADVDVDGNGEVTTWRDKSGVGDANRNVTPPTADNPAWNATDADYGGKPTVGTFNRVGTFRLASGAWNATYGTFTLGIVGHSSNSGNRYFTYESASNYNALLNGSGSPACYANDAGAGDSISSAGDLSKPRSFFATAFAGASSANYVEGAPPDAASLGASTIGGTGVKVGCYEGASGSFGVEKLAEVYAFSRALTLREVRTLRRYRDSYYGAPA